jgi:hypothetical protein
MARRRASWPLNTHVVERLRSDAPLNEVDPATLYGGGALGYTDYPALAHVRSGALKPPILNLSA